MNAVSRDYFCCSAKHITFPKEPPIEVGDIVRGKGVASGMDRVGVVSEIRGDTVALDTVIIDLSTATLVCRRADRLDLGGK